MEGWHRHVAAARRGRAGAGYSQGVAANPDLGLFPLDLVLLPGESLGLHLFEPRYRQLFADCVLDDVPFVLVRGGDDGRAGVGCAARFVAIARRHGDGRMDVTVRGDHPVELLEPTGGRLYHSSRARRLEDADEPPAGDLAESVLTRYLALAGAGGEPPDAGDAPLSYAVAGTLRLSASVRQTLLEERSERARLRLVEDVLAGSERHVETAERAARRAPTNGRVDHS